MARAKNAPAHTHGRLGSSHWDAPSCVTEVDVNARLSFTSIKAHEYSEQQDVLKQKVALLADLIRQSKRCVAFTGAGISTAAGIDDYATKAREDSVVAESRPRLRDWKDAQPTTSHRVLTALYQAGLLKHWVQQNHDSLPQKAGYPQHALNEIHGSLHDPANPIVPYEGSLRDDLFAWFEEWKRKNDLCLALGTSLSGFNVDSMAEIAAGNWYCGKSSGLVIVNLQETPYDALCSLRIFAKIDTVMELLAMELNLAEHVKPSTHVHRPLPAEGSEVGEDMFMVPFDGEGEPSASKILWDLRIGKLVRLTGGPYDGDIGRIMEKSDAGHYRLRFEDSINPQFDVKRRPFSLWLGSWWIQEATLGYGIYSGGKIPLVSVDEEAKGLTQSPGEQLGSECISSAPKRPASLPVAPPCPPAGKGKGKGKGKRAGNAQSANHIAIVGSGYDRDVDASSS